MANIQYGSQTFPWQMNVTKYAGKVPHMVKVLKEAGFTGMEAEIEEAHRLNKPLRFFKDRMEETYEIER